MDREIDKVIEIVGSQAALARALGVSNNAVCKWVAQGFVPSGRVIEIMALVKGKKTADGKTVRLEALLLQSFTSRHAHLSQSPPASKPRSAKEPLIHVGEGARARQKSGKRGRL